MIGLLCILRNTQQCTESSLYRRNPTFKHNTVLTLQVAYLWSLYTNKLRDRVINETHILTTSAGNAKPSLTVSVRVGCCHMLPWPLQSPSPLLLSGCSASQRRICEACKAAPWVSSWFHLSPQSNSTGWPLGQLQLHRVTNPSSCPSELRPAEADFHFLMCLTGFS